MIQLGTILWLAFAVTAGIGLFQVKYEVQALEEELTDLHRQILHDQEAIHVLRAEWSYLNDPDRLAELADRYLDMAPLTSAQLTRFDALPEPLPLPPLAPPRLMRSPDGPNLEGQPAAHSAVFASTGTKP